MHFRAQRWVPFPSVRLFRGIRRSRHRSIQGTRRKPCTGRCNPRIFGSSIGRSPATSALWMIACHLYRRERYMIAAGRHRLPYGIGRTSPRSGRLEFSTDVYEPSRAYCGNLPCSESLSKLQDRLEQRAVRLHPIGFESPVARATVRVEIRLSPLQPNAQEDAKLRKIALNDAPQRTCSVAGD